MNYCQMKNKYKFNFDPKTKPYPHQIDAINYLANRKIVALFDEQGVGKTKIVIDALCKNISEKKLDGALVICKKHLIENWKEEIRTHSYLNYTVLRGNPNEKGISFMTFSHFYILNYESVINEVNRLKMFLKIRNIAIILDESHKIKNPSAKTCKAVFELRDLAKKRVIITGSPMANKPIDLWAQFYFLDKGLLLGNNYKSFSKKYAVDLRGDKIANQKEKFRNLRTIISNNSIRRLKKDVLELPEKIFIEKNVVLEKKQQQAYNKLRDELYLEIVNTEGEQVIDESSQILKKILRLAQIASNPFLVDKSHKETPAKFKTLDVLVKDILSRNEKLIIWTSFVDNIRVLFRRYSVHGSLILYGGVPLEKRKGVVKKFKENFDYRILIANPAAAKEGLTLTSANNAIYLDRNFSLVDYLQSQDRIHRISQTKKCHIYKLIAANTIDEYIDEIIFKKEKLAKYIQGDTRDIVIDQFLSKGELLNILGGHSNGKKK